MNFFDHRDLGNHLLQLCPKVVKHPVYPSQHFPYGAAFVCQAGNFWTLLRKTVQYVRKKMCVVVTERLVRTSKGQQKPAAYENPKRTDLAS